jgi:hypothetical protein
MLISAELRWFWRATLPPGLEQWFRSGTLTPGGGNSREDEYLVDPLQRELGVKKRSSRAEIEIKGLVEVRAALPAPFSGRVQIWAKWTSRAITIDHLPRTVVRKTRWLRKYDTSSSAVRELEVDTDEQLRDSAPLPEHGCNLEVVALTLDDDARWWTFGFEAFGPLDSVERSLHRTISHVPPIGRELLAGGLELSYPDWLSTARS